VDDWKKDGSIGTSHPPTKKKAWCQLAKFAPRWIADIRFGSFIVRLAPLADMLPFLQINRVTRVYRAHVLAALTKPLARRLCRLRPPPPSPAPFRACGGRARRSHRPALASPRYW
jgi:hypothetical protein